MSIDLIDVGRGTSVGPGTDLRRDLDRMDRIVNNEAQDVPYEPYQYM